jgi:hypothetical protein
VMERATSGEWPDCQALAHKAAKVSMTRECTKLPMTILHARICQEASTGLCKLSKLQCISNFSFDCIL